MNLEEFIFFGIEKGIRYMSESVSKQLLEDTVKDTNEEYGVFLILVDGNKILNGNDNNYFLTNGTKKELFEWLCGFRTAMNLNRKK